jgi:hypothetical protein
VGSDAQITRYDSVSADCRDSDGWLARWPYVRATTDHGSAGQRLRSGAFVAAGRAAAHRYSRPALASVMWIWARRWVASLPGWVEVLLSRGREGPVAGLWDVRRIGW